MEKITFFIEDEEGIYTRRPYKTLAKAIKELRDIDKFCVDTLWVEVEDSETKEKYKLEVSKKGKLIRTEL